MTTYVSVLRGSDLFVCLIQRSIAAIPPYSSCPSAPLLPATLHPNTCYISRKGVNCLLMLPPNSLTMLKSDGACHGLENSLLKMGAPNVPTSFVQMVCIYSLEAPPSQRRSSILQVVFLQSSGIFPLRHF